MFLSKYSSSAGLVPWTLFTLLPVLLCSASPTPVDLHVVKNPQHDLVFREALELAHQPHLEKRLEADFSLDRAWEKNHVLFAGSWTNTGAGLGVTDSVSLSVVCAECWTKGTVSAKLTEDLIDPTVRLDFHGVEAYVDIDVDITAGAAYAVNLFTSQSPLGLGFPGLSIGLVFYVDLVFALTAEIDLQGGFYVQVEDGSFLETSILGGDVTDSLFEGLKSKSLPVTVRKGSATFKADLRLRVQCGAEMGLDGIGLAATAEVGIYANLIEFVAVLESTPTCALQSTEWWDLNVGAFARFGVVIDYKTFGVVPTVSTTLLSAPTMTQCWLEIGAGPTGVSVGGAGVGNGAVITATTAPAGSLSSPSVAAVGGGYFQTVVSDAQTSTGTPSSSLAGPIITSPSSAAPSLPAGNSSVYPIYSASSSGGGIISSSHAPDDGTYPTTTYVITSCAATVPNCPNSLQHEITVTRTIKDVYPSANPLPLSDDPKPDYQPTGTATCTKSGKPAPASAKTTTTTAATSTAAIITKDIIVLQPCKTPITSTFTYTPPGATVLPPSSSSSSLYPAIPTNGYQFPNGSSITTILGFSTLAPSEIITVTSTSVSLSVAVPVPTEYPVTIPAPVPVPQSSSVVLPSPSSSVVTAGAAGNRMLGTGSLLAGAAGVAAAAGIWLW